jgi:hypothetical protein
LQVIRETRHVMRTKLGIYIFITNNTSCWLNDWNGMGLKGMGSSKMFALQRATHDQ